MRHVHTGASDSIPDVNVTHNWPDIGAKRVLDIPENIPTLGLYTRNWLTELHDQQIHGGLPVGCKRTDTV